MREKKTKRGTLKAAKREADTTKEKKNLMSETITSQNKAARVLGRLEPGARHMVRGKDYYLTKKYPKNDGRQGGGIVAKLIC